MLLVPPVGFNARRPPVLTYQSVSDVVTDTNTPSFAAMALGSDAADRLVVVAFCTESNSAISVSSVTIAGVAATIVASRYNLAHGMIVIAQALVPSGSSGTMAVTWVSAPSVVRTRCYVWTITGLRSNTAIDTQANSANSGTSSSVTISVPSYGVVVCAKQTGDGVADIAWTNATENHDATLETNFRTSAASYAGGRDPESRTISTAHANSTGALIQLCASWG